MSPTLKRTKGFFGCGGSGRARDERIPPARRAPARGGRLRPTFVHETLKRSYLEGVAAPLSIFIFSHLPPP